MNPRTLQSALTKRAAVCRTHVTFATERERERVISLSTTALIMIAGLGTFAMSGLIAV